MTELELIKNLNEKVKNGQSDIALYLKGRCGSRNYRKLYGVKGEIITETDNNMLLCMFPAKELLNAVIKSLPTYTLKEKEDNDESETD